MSISERAGAGLPRRLTRAFASLAAVASLITAVVHCGSPDRCLRFSDCSVGFTCVTGACVPEMGPEESPPLVASTIVDAAADAARADASPAPIADAGTDREAAADAADAADPIDDTTDF